MGTSQVMRSENNEHNQKHLISAKQIINDEFYTPKETILTELNHYKKYLVNKKVLCPCDLTPTADIMSLTFDFETNCCNINDVAVAQNFITQDIYRNYKQATATIDEGLELLNKSYISNFVKVLFDLQKECQIKSITASGYDIKTGDGISVSDVDFTKYDFVITNPPFSLISRSFAPQLTKAKEQKPTFEFLFLGLFAAAQYVSVYNKMWAGYTIDFKGNFVDANGKPTKTQPNCSWFTSFEDAQLERDEHPIEFEEHYEDGKYEKLYTIPMCDPEVDFVLNIRNRCDIPKDYPGWMLTSIELYSAGSRKQFEMYIAHPGPAYDNDVIKGLTTNNFVDNTGKHLYTSTLFRFRQQNDKNE